MPGKSKHFVLKICFYEAPPAPLGRFVSVTLNILHLLFHSFVGPTDIFFNYVNPKPSKKNFDLGTSISY